MTGGTTVVFIVATGGPEAVMTARTVSMGVMMNGMTVAEYAIVAMMARTVSMRGMTNGMIVVETDVSMMMRIKDRKHGKTP